MIQAEWTARWADGGGPVNGPMGLKMYYYRFAYFGPMGSHMTSFGRARDTQVDTCHR